MRALHWFRSDLRVADNAGLAAACRRASQLLPVFVFDDRLLASPRQGAPRVRFLRACVERLARELERRGTPLVVRCGNPVEEIPRLCESARIELVTWNRDYSPFARARDAAVELRLGRAGVRTRTFKDRVVWESREVLSRQRRPFSVYSPYRKVWWSRLREDPLEGPGPLRLPPPVPRVARGALPSERSLGVRGDGPELPTAGEEAAWRRLRAFLERDASRYAQARDIPALRATSRLSPYLRLGVISARQCFREALAFAAEEPTARGGVQKWLDELIWREFYHAILAEHPRVLGSSYRPEYDSIEWQNDEAMFAAWRAGRTGYPFVDAAMRELDATGLMHNRARMVVASFLTKDLLIDWRWGERTFMERLVDGDPASNNGGWQWSASTGTDAQPYFRIFNPVSQGERFDPEGDYVRRWVPELAGLAGKRIHRPWDAPLEAPRYPRPLVDHGLRRQLALERYGAARAGASA